MQRRALDKRKRVHSGTFLTLPWLSPHSHSIRIFSCLPHFITSELCSLIVTSGELVRDSAPFSHRYWRPQGAVIWLRHCWKQLLPFIWNHYPRTESAGAGERCTYSYVGSKGTTESTATKRNLPFKVHTELWSRLSHYTVHSQQYSHPVYF